MEQSERPELADPGLAERCICSNALTCVGTGMGADVGADEGADEGGDETGLETGRVLGRLGLCAPLSGLTSDPRRGRDTGAGRRDVCRTESGCSSL